MSQHNSHPPEDDSWFSREQLESLERAEGSDTLRAAVPTRNVSNGEYVPFAQTRAQREVEARVVASAGEAAGRLGLSRRRFLSGAGGNAQTPSHIPPSGLTCPADKVVWVNTRSGVYHFRGQRYFASTQQGKFTCEKDALREGDRPTRNGQ